MRSGLALAASALVRRRTWVVRARCVALLLVALALTGCGVLLPSPEPPPTDRTGQVQVAWILRDAAGRQLELGVPMGGSDCSRFEGVDVQEMEEAIEIRAWLTDVSNGGACAMVLVIQPVTVELRAPLGARHLTGCLIERSGAQFQDRQNCAEVVGG